MKQLKLPAVFMRGGTSNAVVLASTVTSWGVGLLGIVVSLRERSLTLFEMTENAASLKPHCHFEQRDLYRRVMGRSRPAGASLDASESGGVSV